MPEICYYASTFISVKEKEPMHSTRSQSCPPGGWVLVDPIAQHGVEFIGQAEV